MHRMNGVDAQILMSDDGRMHTHVGILTILEGTAEDGSPITLDRIRALLEERLPLMPLFTWHVKKVPLNLDYPVFVEDPDFDLDDHVWETAVAKPGTDKQLGELVGRLYSRPLDLQRPLWELYLIHGLEGGRVAMLTKIHHAAIDGVTGIELTGTLMDATPEGRVVEPPVAAAPEPEPSDLGLALRGVVALPRQAVRAARVTPRVLRNLDQTNTRNLPGGLSLSEAANAFYDRITRGRDGEVLSRPAGKAPNISMGGPVSAHRAVSFTKLDLATVRAIRATMPGTTINDVVVALCAGAMRRRMQARGDSLHEPLVACIPIYVGSGGPRTHGNHISLMYIKLPTNEPDPAARLAKSHEALVAAKSLHNAIPAPMMMDAAIATPPALLAGAARTVAMLGEAGLTSPTQNVTISNVPGPQVQLYCAGAKVIGQFPLSIVLHGLAATITILSYNGSLDIGIVTERHHAPDVWELVDDFGAELKALVKATGVAQ
jgi:diacylglycerol O-acyltransferase